MANIVQMGVDEFWQSLQDLGRRAKRERARLNDNKLKLQHAWTQTKQDPDASRRAAHQAMLRPLIHANSKSRVDYANLEAQFNRAANGAAGVLRQVGLSAPNLSGYMAGPELILVPVVAVAALGAAWLIYNGLHDQQANQTRLIDAAVAILNNPESTPAQKQQAMSMLTKAQANPPHLDPLNLDALMPIALAVAAIVVLPPVLDLFTPRRPRRAAA